MDTPFEIFVRIALRRIKWQIECIARVIVVGHPSGDFLEWERDTLLTSC